LDLIFDKSAVVIGLFYVLCVVGFQRLDAVPGLAGNESGLAPIEYKKLT
jgi:hypothetical protein